MGQIDADVEVAKRCWAGPARLSWAASPSMPHPGFTQVYHDEDGEPMWERLQSALAGNRIRQLTDDGRGERPDP